MKFLYVKFIFAITLITCCVAFFLKPILQDTNYHLFADCKFCCKTPNFWNVWTNLPFVFFGLIGLFTTNKFFKTTYLKINFYWFFGGILLTGFGSAYYHYLPKWKVLYHLG